MTLPSHFLIILLLLPFLQPWRLAASTPGAEDFFKYVAEEGERLVDEVIGEDNSINHEFPLNSAQAAVQTGIHSVPPSVECAPTDHQSSSNSACSSKPQLPSPATASASLISHLQPPTTVRPVGRIVTTVVREENTAAVFLPHTTISAATNECNNTSSNASKNHDVTTINIKGIVIDLVLLNQIKDLTSKKEEYENLSETILKEAKGINAVFASIIDSWETFKDQKEAFFQQIDAKADEAIEQIDPRSHVAQEQKKVIQENQQLIKDKLFLLDQLTISQEVLNIAIQYKNKFANAFLEAEDPALKHFYYKNLDSINNNIENLEKAAAAVITLSEQKNRCLASAAVATEEEENIDIAKQFQAAAKAAEEAITSYCEFAQEMKQGDVPSASLLRIKGFSLECYALEVEYNGHAAMSEDETQADNFDEVSNHARKAADLFKKAAQTKSEGKIEAAKAYEQTAQYHLQAAQAGVNGDTTNAKNFSKAAYHISKAAYNLGKVAQVKSESQTEDTKIYEQTAQYHFQAAQAAVNGDTTKTENFLEAAYNTSSAGEALKIAANARNEGKENKAKVLEQAAQYFFQAVQAAVNGDSTQAKNYSREAYNILCSCST
ncbi:MAG TPA: hypothetical protein VJK54_07560 [Chthoniobacterales bacterium]|nr:hypothetical protein [Chthoniobacterales bacterium]